MRPWHLLTLFLQFCLIGCKADNSPAQHKHDGKMVVVATTGMIADMVQNITGDQAKVFCLMGSGVDPHSYEPRESDVTKILEAQLVVYNGLHLEGKMSDLLEQSNKKGNFIALAQALEKSDLRFENNEPDPHIWFDVQLWKKCSAFVTEKIASMRPEMADEVRKNGGKYMEKLEALDKDIRAKISTIPPTQRVLITAHDAFGYFGKAYGFEVRGVQGISTVSETSNQEIANLAKFMVERKIRAFFVENSVSRKNLEKLKEVVGTISKDFSVREGGELYSDALGPPKSLASTYEGMIRHNLESITKGLAP